MESKIVLLAFWMVCTVTQAPAQYIDYSIIADKLSFGEDSIVSDNAVIEADVLNIEDSIYIENHGIIDTGIFHVCDACIVQFRNSGSFNASKGFELGSGTELIQLIRTAEDITCLSVDVPGFSILVQSSDTLSMSEIMRIAPTAERIVLKDAVLLFSPNSDLPSAAARPEIELVGEVLIEIDSDVSDGTILLGNVVGTRVADVRYAGLSPLHVARAVRCDDNICLRIVRETDYRKILGDSAGRFLDEVRSASPDNRALFALDNAGVMSDFQNIALKSAMLNPFNLMRPLRMFHNFETVPLESSRGTFAVEPVYIFSESFDLHAEKLSAEIIAGSWGISGTGYIGQFDNADDLNEFSGFMYGGNMRVSFTDKYLWFHSILGFTKAAFKTEMLFDGSGAAYNPDSISVYGAADIGEKFNLYNEFYISMFLGYGTEYGKVLHQSEMQGVVRAGATAGFGTSALGIKYDYQILAMITTGNVQDAGFRIDIWSVADSAGGSISSVLSHDEFGFSYKLSAELKFMF